NSVNAPTNLRVRAAGPQLVHLTWDDNSGGTAQFKSIRLEEFSTTPSVQDAIPSKKLDDTSNLKEGTTYFYTLKATLGTAVSDASNPGQATTFPEAPVNIAATPEETNRIDLRWTNKSIKAHDVIIQDESAGSVSETVVSAVTAQPYQITVNEGSDHKY